MPLQLICLDLDNTLWPVEPVIAHAETETWRWLSGHAPEVAARLVDSQTLRSRRLALLTARPDYLNNLTALRRDATLQSMLDSGVAEPIARELAQQALNVFLEHRNAVTFFPDVEAVLTRLAGRYRLAAISNGNADLSRIGVAHWFDLVLSAEKVGRAKPDPAMFVRALTETGVAAHHAVHIGDHPEQDVQAARDHGMAAIWANPLRLPRPALLPADIPAFEHFADLELLLAQLHDRPQTR